MEENQEKPFVFKDWLAEGMRGMALCVPRDAGSLVRGALREVLLFDRALVDKVVEYLEEKPGPDRARRIKIE